jgi:hypothetical protein
MPQLPPIGADVSHLVQGGSLPPIGAEIDADLSNAPTPHEVPRAHAQLDDTPGMFGSAGRRELFRTGKEAAIGLARSPLDAVSGLFNLVRHPIDSATNLASAVAHPLDTVEALGDDPRAAGSMLGQVLLGKLVPGNLGKIGEVGARGVAGVGRGAGAVGRGMETLAASKPIQRMSELGALGEALYHGNPVGGMAAYMAPTAIKYGGKGLQAAGSLMERAPGAMESLMGSSASTLEDAAAARQANFRSDMTPAEPMTPWSPFEASASADAAPYSHISTDGAPRFTIDGSDVTAAEAQARGYSVGEVPMDASRASSTAARDAAQARQTARQAERAPEAIVKPHQRLGPGGTREPLPYGLGESAWDAGPVGEIPDAKMDELINLFGGKRTLPSMEALEGGGSLETIADVRAPKVFGRDAFNAKFHQQMMDSIARGR